MIYYLKHHGIEGQKWGEQNGPPYPLDKSESLRIKRRGARQKQKEMSKNRSTLTDEEIKKQIERLQLEIKLRDLTESNLHPARAKTKQILTNVSQVSVNNISKNAIDFAFKRATS